MFPSHDLPGPSGKESTSKTPTASWNLLKFLLPPDLLRYMSPIIAQTFINPKTLLDLSALNVAAIFSGVKSTCAALIDPNSEPFEADSDLSVELATAIQKPSFWPMLSVKLTLSTFSFSFPNKTTNPDSTQLSYGYIVSESSVFLTKSTLSDIEGLYLP